MSIIKVTPESVGHPKRVNKTLMWGVGSDKEETYLKNLENPDTREMLEKYNWIDVQIEYKFNSHGFRCQEFDLSKSVIFLGCSYTMGVGVPEEHSYPYHVAKDLGLTNYNLSLTGGSPDSAFKVAYYWVKKLRPELVIHGYQDFGTGAELFTPNGGRYTETLGRPMFGNFTEVFWKSSMNNRLRRVRNALAIRQLCNEVGTRYVPFQMHSWDKNNDILTEVNYEPDLARDLGHYGRNANRFIADRVLQLIDNPNDSDERFR